MTPAELRTHVATTALEHALRCSSDISAVLAIRDAEQGTPSAFAALGRLVAAALVPLQAGAPVAVFCQGGTIDPLWRGNCPLSPMSLWGELETLRALYQSSEIVDGQPDLVDELLSLRDVAVNDLS